MKIAIIQRFNFHNVWGGDLRVLFDVVEGLKELGHEATILNDVTKIKDEEFIFLSNSGQELFAQVNFLKAFIKKEYGIIPFHEDIIKYTIPSFGFYKYIEKNLLNKKDKLFDFSIDRLIENPSLVYYFFDSKVESKLIYNYEAFKSAKVCIANSKKEANTILRDCPSANARVAHITDGCEDYNQHDEDDSFLKLCGLKSGEYILQIGRLEERKNQLATVLATKDLDIPLVFIATKSFFSALPKKQLLITAILKWRKAPTIIISQDLPEGRYKNLQIISMSEKKFLRRKIIYSAFIHCGLHVHPAFYELPGATYLEAAKLGVPTIASNWTSIKEYFSDRDTGKYLLDDRIEYVEPHDIGAITKLIKKKFGQKYSINPDLWIFKRTKKQMAEEVLNTIKCL